MYKTCIMESVDNELLQGQESFMSGPFKVFTSFVGGFTLQLSEPLCSFVEESVDGVLCIFLKQYNKYARSKFPSDSKKDIRIQNSDHIENDTRKS